MALFQPKNPETKVARDLEAAIARRADIEARLKTAEQRVVECRSNAHGLARDGADDSKLDAAEAALRAAQDRVSTLSAALAGITKDVAALEAMAAAIADKKLRAATAAEIEKITAELQQAGDAFEEAAAELAAAARRAGDVVVDAQPLMHYAQGAASEVPPAIAMCAKMLRDRATATIAGSGPARLPQPAAPPPRLTLVEAPTMQSVFIMKPSRYRDADGRQVACGQYRVCELPLAIAERALKTGAAIPVTDKRRRELQGMAGMIDPDLVRCQALDDSPLVEPKSNVAPIMSSHVFEPHPDITGNPFPAKMSRPPEPVPMAASRSADEE